MSHVGKAAAEAVPNFKGAAIPDVGLGPWQADSGVVGNAVKQAIKRGHRHIDCAKAYKNETEIGNAPQELYKGGVVERKDLFITSKLWLETFHSMPLVLWMSERCAVHNPDDVADAVNGLIQRLQFIYLDLDLMPWPLAFKKAAKTNPPLLEDFAPISIQATWGAMENCHASGKAKAIGTSNFSVEKSKSLLSYCKVRPAANQVECHPLWQQNKLAPFLKSESIHLSAYSPIGSSNSALAKINVLELPTVTKLAE